MSVDPPAERFEALLERPAGVVAKVASLYGRSAEEGFQLAQEIRAQLERANLLRERSPDALRTYRVALNAALGFVRGARGRPGALLELAQAPREERGDAEEEPDRASLLAQFLAGLGALDRALWFLHLEELTHGEIAEVLGLDEIRVATRLGRLKHRLRRAARDL